MKRFIMFGILLALLIAGPVMAQDVDEWHIANQATMAWDPVTELINGNPVPANDAIEYEVYWVKRGLPKDSVDLLAPVGTVTETQFTYTFSEESDYILGARAVRIPETSPDVRLSGDVAWSDNPEVCQDNSTFGIRYYVTIKIIMGLRPIP